MSEVRMNAIDTSPEARAAIPDLTRLKQGWMFVGKAWQDNHPLCEECHHNRTWGEPRPYGDGTAYEAMSECMLGQMVRDKPEGCPAYQQHLNESEEA